MGSNPFSGARHSAWIHLISSDWILIKWARWELSASDLDERVGLTVNRKSCRGRSWDTGRLRADKFLRAISSCLGQQSLELVMAFQIHINFASAACSVDLIIIRPCSTPYINLVCGPQCQRRLRTSARFGVSRAANVQTGWEVNLTRPRRIAATMSGTDSCQEIRKSGIEAALKATPTTPVFSNGSLFLPRNGLRLGSLFRRIRRTRGRAQTPNQSPYGNCQNGVTRIYPCDSYNQL